MHSLMTAGSYTWLLRGDAFLYAWVCAYSVVMVWGDDVGLYRVVLYRVKSYACRMGV
ncbi:hypothetical protein ACLOJK_027189, partial [Asimina triloba]